MKNAKVRIHIDKQGLGHLVLNGIHIDKVVTGFRLFSQPGQEPILQVDILVGELDLEGDEVGIILTQLTPENEVRKHDIDALALGGRGICRVCRQVVGCPRWNPDECPGPLSRNG
jgi:hypothetical protein